MVSSIGLYKMARSELLLKFSSRVENEDAIDTPRVGMLIQKRQFILVCSMFILLLQFHLISFLLIFVSESNLNYF